ncbi:MAG: M20 family metallopeptidase [bacterium]
MNPKNERIIAYIHEQRPKFVEFLRELVLAESPSLQPETQEPVMEQLTEALRNIDYHVLRVPGRKTAGHLFARPRHSMTRGNGQLLIGHCDTVWPVGTIAKMPLEVSDSVIKGPGVFDMKGGLAMLIFALQALHDLRLQPEVSPLIFINSDEEIGSPESRSHFIEIARTVDRTLVLEPALGLSGKLKTARKGVGDFVVTVKGKAAHAGLDPERGASAILELSYIVQKLFALNNPQRGITVNVGTIGGGVRSNVIAPESSASIDVRVLYEEDSKHIEEAILNLQPTTPGVTIEVTGCMDRGPMERTPRNQALWRAAKDLGREIGLELEEGTSGGASDGNFTSYYTATLDGLGPVGDGAHAYHEFVDIDKTIPRCVLLSLLLLEPQIQITGQPQYTGSE